MTLDYNPFKENVKSIIERNLDTSPSEKSIMDTLEKWSVNKQSLYNRFNHKLIISSDLLELNLCDNDIEDYLETFVKNLHKFLPMEDARCLRIFIMQAVRLEGFKENKVMYDWETDPENCFSIYGKPTFDAINIKKGMKFTKAMKFFFNATNKDKLVDIQNYYSTFAQNMRSKKRGKIHLSIHPFDFLSISDNDRDWDSCHSMYDGDYRIGNLNYMADGVTCIAYYTTEDDNFDRLNDAFGSELAWNSKCWRMLVHLKEENGKMVVLYNKHYPYTSAQFLTEVDKIILDCYKDIPLSELSMYGEVDKYISYNSDNCCHYSDIDRVNAYIKVRYYSPNPDDFNYSLQIGEPVLCLNCGEHYAVETRDGLCDYCTDDSVSCDRCGEYCNEEDLIYIESEDNYVCPHCLDNYYFYCGCCDVYYRNEDLEVVNDKNYCAACAEALKEEREE